jgi:hypothetical protein
MPFVQCLAGLWLFARSARAKRVLRLIGQVITVSLETMKLVKALPEVIATLIG